MRNVTVKGRRVSVIGNLPSENAAEAVLGLLRDWPELSGWCNLEQLAIDYHFDYFTLKAAFRALKTRGLIEAEERPVERKFFFLFPYQDTETYCRRISTATV
ncbi:MAG: hypothetical protein RLZZ480_872 [Candidatus Parcubacteria bacterium]|jgi:hypothetical protein